MLMSQVVYQNDRHTILNIFSSQCHQPSCTVFAVNGFFWFYQDRTMFDQNPTDNFWDRTRAINITIDIHRSSFCSLNLMSRSRHPTTDNRQPTTGGHTFFKVSEIFFFSEFDFWDERGWEKEGRRDWAKGGRVNWGVRKGEERGPRQP